MSEPTHEVTNQAPPLEDYNPFELDQALQEAMTRADAGWATEQMQSLGARVGSAEVIRWGFEANRHSPVLRTHDRFGHRVDEVDFHPAWHALMGLAVEHGLHSLPWEGQRAGAHAARAGLFMLGTQAEPGHGCPISMTYSSIPALRKQPELAQGWEAGITSRVYDGRCLPASEKRGLLIGMAMTEKQGGSDVRANRTRAEAIGSGGPGGEYLLTGHKWFCSAPMNDAFLVLAQAPGGLSCFLLPRWLPDGSRNRFHIQRLKDKLGNRSNASSEVEFQGAWARMINEEGRGVPTIIEMVGHTRLDCVLGSAAGMRLALSQAIHHCAHRKAFGQLLVEQPAMQNVLADLALESEAATVLAIRLAQAFDAAGVDETAQALRRLATPVAKYWVCKRAAVFAAEALECHGGNGYVEESVMPRLFRESPLNSIWEGSGNVICLDVLRALGRDPGSAGALLAEIELARGGDPRLDKAVDELKLALAKPQDLQQRARRLVEQMVLVLQGSLLVRHSSSSVADAFCASRLGGDWGRNFGTLPPGLNLGEILTRTWPRLA